MKLKGTKLVVFPARAGSLPAALFGLRAAALGLLAGAFGVLAGALGLPAGASAAAGRITVESGGVARTAFLVEHQRLKKARRPVVVVLRGGGDKGGRLRRAFGLEELARSSGPVLIYPDALGGHWSSRPGPEMNRDEIFIRDLITKLVADGIANRHKIFIIGIKSGGPTAFRLACGDANAFAAAAVVLTEMPADLASTCKPSRPLPFLLIAGAEDSAAPNEGGKGNSPEGKGEPLSADATLAVFGKAAGCGESRTTTALPSRDPHEPTRVYLDKLNGCKAPVELVRIEGDGHSVPGRSSAIGFDSARGQRNLDVDGARIVWDFFRRLGD